jgi:hypothetical protein
VSDRPKAPLTTTTSIWPAAAVLGIAVVMLVVFMIINAASDQGVTTTTTVPTVVGGLVKAPNADALTYCRTTSEIPSNIVGAFVVPANTTIEPGSNIPNSGAGDYDCYQPLSTATTSGSLLAFYATQLEARGWSLFSRGASNGEPQSLFQKGGTDGFYWVVGVTVNSASNGRVHWTYRIYQNSESI